MCEELGGFEGHQGHALLGTMALWGTTHLT